ncbi:nucleoside hydrolase [Corynebacterium sp. CCUG 18816]|uniref:Nucleoside hydrolase n=1 Tax=Corynebacterium lipophilum TaxID=2804918 RepID=A0AAW5HU06_9CORY|nr:MULTISPECIES: nucleoside hydrolase [Corynebacterium]MCO6394470.1 nucleoside hydrolase [Corynebacterium lipophilum]MCQ4616032.1 nucleoside hydrolase [Corynebacterium pseudogenitalium]MCZ2117435.1 nucleoside hydrolase [Corynebacterium lipophilum]
MTTKIILDCDPGHDDAVAILLAAGNSNIELLGVTTVGGNHTLEKVTRNAAQVLTVAKLTDVPLYAGATRPILREVETAEGIHGDTGMEIHGFELPEPALSVQETHGVQFIIDTIMNEPAGTVTLVPTGPLTNIALAARLEPRIVERVKEVVLMGGAYGTGNWTPSAEFNIIVDPEAAHIVFNEKWPVVMVGLDLTHQALATKEVEEQFAALGTNVGDFVVGLFGAFRKNYQDAQGFDDPPVHDPCCVAYLIDPTVVETVKVPVDVETQGLLTTGRTVADFRSPAPADCHTSVATKLDAERFWSMVLDAVKALG